MAPQQIEHALECPAGAIVADKGARPVPRVGRLMSVRLCFGRELGQGGAMAAATQWNLKKRQRSPLLPGRAQTSASVALKMLASR